MRGSDRWRAYAFRISSRQPTINQPRKIIVASTKQISAPNIVQLAEAVTPRKADKANKRPPSTAIANAIEGVCMICPDAKYYLVAATNASSVYAFGQ